MVIYALPILLKISPLLKTWYLAKKTHHAPIALSDRLHGRLAFIGRAFIVLEQHLKCLKKTNAQELTAANKQVRMATSGQVLEPHGKLHIFCWWEAFHRFCHNQLAKRSFLHYVHPNTIKKNSNETRLFQIKSTLSKLVMVLVDVCKRGCTEIHFIELGVKVDGHTILTVFLPRRVLLPNIGRYLKVGFWSFNRTVHQLIKTWHRRFPGEKDTWLYLPILWLPNLPDLNPVDYSIWKRRFTAPELTISTNSKCVWSMSGHASTSW